MNSRRQQQPLNKDVRIHVLICWSPNTRHNEFTHSMVYHSITLRATQILVFVPL